MKRFRDSVFCSFFTSRQHFLVKLIRNELQVTLLPFQKEEEEEEEEKEERSAALQCETTRRPFIFAFI